MGAEHDRVRCMLSDRAVRWTLLLCTAALLLAQMLGLHHHQHLGAIGAPDAHDAVAGGEWHVGIAHADHHAHLDAGHSGAAHLDVEADGLKAMLAKLMADGLLALPAAIAIGLLAVAVGVSRSPHFASRAPCRRSIFALTPPAQAPPRPF